jgi:hypothetical protein
MNYTPQANDRVVARRKVPSKIYFNTVIGPVVEVFQNACRVKTNEGTEIESDFQLFFSDWKFDKLNI